jgi:hypothetical protein
LAAAALVDAEVNANRAIGMPTSNSLKLPDLRILFTIIASLASKELKFAVLAGSSTIPLLLTGYRL